VKNKLQHSFLRLFRRETANGNYLAFVDGLRFIAVALVVLFHLCGYFEQAYSSAYSNTAFIVFKPLLKNGHRGVDLFFVLSAFILGYNALRYREIHQNTQPLAQFYSRRFYRIYPPFAIAMLLIFIGNVWIIPQFTFYELAPSFLSTLSYTNNAISHFYHLPELSDVTWTLEIEIQFYLLFPFLGILYSLPILPRRLIMFFSILLCVFVRQSISIPFATLFSFMPLFLAGLLFADFYYTKYAGFVTHPLLAFLAILSLFLLIILPDKNIIESTLFQYSYPYIILLFFGFSSQNSIMLYFLRQPLVCIVGGMCYSIYLLHATIISIFHKFIGEKLFFDSAPIDGILWLALNIICIILASTLFYYFMEKPFMSRKNRA